MQESGMKETRNQFEYENANPREDATRLCRMQELKVVCIDLLGDHIRFATSTSLRLAIDYELDTLR